MARRPDPAVIPNFQPSFPVMKPYVNPATQAILANLAETDARVRSLEASVLSLYNRVELITARVTELSQTSGFPNAVRPPPPYDSAWPVRYLHNGSYAINSNRPSPSH